MQNVQLTFELCDRKRQRQTALIVFHIIAFEGTRMVEDPRAYFGSLGLQVSLALKRHPTDLSEASPYRPNI